MMKEYLYVFLLLESIYVICQEAGENMYGAQDQQVPAEQAPVAPETWKISEYAPPAENPFRGNWYKKRDIVRSGRALYEEIHTLVSEVWEPLFEQFDATYSVQLQALHDRMRVLSIDDAELDWVLAHIQELTMRPTVSNANSSVIPEYIITMSEEAVRNDLTTLREELDLTQKRLQDFENGIGIARQHSGLGSSYEQQAWKYYVDMDAAYDDRAAQLLLQKMMAQRDHLQELMSYLSNQLVPYCAEVSQMFDAHMLKATMLRDGLLKAHVPLTHDAFRMQKDKERAEKNPPIIPSYGALARAVALITQPFVIVQQGLKYGVQSIASLFGYTRV